MRRAHEFIGGAMILLLALVTACSKSPAGSERPVRSAGSGSADSAGSAGAPASTRIVTLAPSATETVAALGATSQLVGVDTYSEYPPEVNALPKVGSFLQPNLEVIVTLAPTLVIVDDIHGATGRALGDAGIKTVECAFHALPDVKRALETVGAAIGRETEAKAAVESIEAALDAAAAARPARHPRVLAIIDRETGGLGNLVAVGPGSWVDELLAVVGGDNVLAASGVRYPKISLEEVLRSQPEVILDLSFAGKSDIAAWNGVDVPAVTNKRVIALSEPYLVAPSPRVKEALDTLARALRAP
jgi:iron complex transport system substrate-binding protein